MIYTDNKGRTLDVTVWDGSDVTEDVLGAPRTGADLDLLVEKGRLDPDVPGGGRDMRAGLELRHVRLLYGMRRPAQ